MESSVFSRIFLISLFVISVLIVNFIFSPIERVIYLAKLKPEVKTLEIDGMNFRDLNKNNNLDQFEDYRLDTAQRVEDLISQMTLEEKIGILFHPPVTINPDWMFRPKHPVRIDRDRWMKQYSYFFFKGHLRY